MISNLEFLEVGGAKKTLALYQPPKEVAEISLLAQEQYDLGYQILTKNWPEMNDMNVIDRETRDKKTFNAYVNESVDDPMDDWKWRGTRSTARNKALAMHAHLTAGFLFPMIDAQNSEDEEDREMGDFMRDILIWMGDNSDYKESFLQVVMGMITNPVSFLGAEWVKKMQKVKVKTDEGYTTKEVLDEELSGFRAPVYGASEVLITNAYVQNMQQQNCVLKRRDLNYSDAYKKYGWHENWQFVQKGVNAILDNKSSLFYEMQDLDNSDTVREVIVSWRGEDLEIPFVGGIYMGSDNVEWNPMRHRDNFNQPKYNVVPFGYHRISEHFFYFKSLMNSLYWDDALADALYENIMNGEFIKQNPPTVFSGDDKITTSVVFPGAQIISAKENFKATSLLPQSSGNPYQALQFVKESIEEGSLSVVQTGQLPEASQKAFSVARAEKNAQILMKGVAQSMGQAMLQYGALMKDIAINHLSVPMIDELTGTGQKLRYRKFMLPRQSSKGKNITKILRFDESLIGKGMSESAKEKYALRLYEEAGEDKVISVVNPALAARMKYLTRIDLEEMFSQNREYISSVLGQLYPMLRQDPLIDAETLVRMWAQSLLRGKGDDLLAKKSDIEMAMKMGLTAGQPNQQIAGKMNQMANQQGGVAIGKSLK